jgi:hypothetical protein
MKARRTFSIDPAEAVHELREILPPGSTAMTVLRSVSSSGMSRAIDVYAPCRRGADAPRRITAHVAVIIDAGWSDRHEALTVQGAGMDMGLDVVYSLSGALWGYGQDLRRMAPSVPLTPRERRRLAAWRRKERARYVDANVSGGYAISHRWL